MLVLWCYLHSGPFDEFTDVRAGGLQVGPCMVGPPVMLDGGPEERKLEDILPNDVIMRLKLFRREAMEGRCSEEPVARNGA